MQVQKVSQVKVQALLALLVHLVLEENLADLDLKVGKNTIFFFYVAIVAFDCDTVEVPTVHVKRFHQVFVHR